MVRVFLTGKPGVGKTTAIKKVLQYLGSNAYGFISEEVRNENRARAGFNLRDIESGKSILMAQKNGHSQLPKIGAYSVDCRKTAELMVQSLKNENGKAVAVMDEIGKMELMSLRDKANYLLEKEFYKFYDKAEHVIGTIPLLAKDKFVEEIKKKTKIIIVDQTNRDSVPDQVIALLNSEASL